MVYHSPYILVDISVSCDVIVVLLRQWWISIGMMGWYKMYYVYVLFLWDWIFVYSTVCSYVGAFHHPIKNQMGVAAKALLFINNKLYWIKKPRGIGGKKSSSGTKTGCKRVSMFGKYLSISLLLRRFCSRVLVSLQTVPFKMFFFDIFEMELFSRDSQKYFFRGSLYSLIYLSDLHAKCWVRYPVSLWSVFLSVH